MVPERTLLSINPSEHTVFPDVICDPALLIAREVKEVVIQITEYKDLAEKGQIVEVNAIKASKKLTLGSENQKHTLNTVTPTVR